jgi:RNA polymerase sigma-70 factor, ECF subfamily
MLYDEFFPWLVRLVRHATRRDDSFAQDASQLALIQAAARMPGLRCRSDIERWLARRAYSRALDAIKSERRRAERERVASRLDGTRLGPTDRADASAELERRLAALSQLDREILQLRILRALPMRTIAGLVGLSEAAIDGRLRRARSALRETTHE